MKSYSFDKPHILFIDNNYAFARDLAIEANRVGMGLHHFESLLELAYQEYFGPYEAVIIGAQCNSTQLEDILNYIALVLGNVPVLLLQKNHDTITFNPLGKPYRHVLHGMSDQSAACDIIMELKRQLGMQRNRLDDHEDWVRNSRLQNFSHAV